MLESALLAFLSDAVFFSSSETVAFAFVGVPFCFLLLHASTVFVAAAVAVLALSLSTKLVFLLLFAVKGVAFVVVGVGAESTSHF